MALDHPYHAGVQFCFDPPFINAVLRDDDNHGLCLAYTLIPNLVYKAIAGQHLPLIYPCVYMQLENPKVFISHASEDKERFVLDFARKLRSKSISSILGFSVTIVREGTSILQTTGETTSRPCGRQSTT